MCTSDSKYLLEHVINVFGMMYSVGLYIIVCFFKTDFTFANSRSY